MDIFRRSIRPVLTLAIVGAYLWGFLHPLEFGPAQLDLLRPAMMIVLTAWFGERALKNLGLDLGKKGANHVG